MDIERGLCWRCEKSGATWSGCLCDIAQYCGRECMDKDLRHQIAECDMWYSDDKECDNASCEEIGSHGRCSKCQEGTYCSPGCQKCTCHKRECKQIRKIVKEMAVLYTQDFLNKDLQTSHTYPFYIGNTLAVDILKLDVNEASGSSKEFGLKQHYNILLAGVGDIRNILLTAESLPSNFTGSVWFTLNDIDPFVLARDVLFLYMMTTQSSRPYIETSITNIWYSLKLPYADYKFLRSVLDELIKHTGETLKKATKDQLDIGRDDFEVMKDVWLKWREMECDTREENAIDLFNQRKEIENEEISKYLKDYITKISQTSYRATAKTYIENGLFLPQSQCEERDLKCFNPTLTGRREPGGSRPNAYKFEYCVERTSLPFYSWDQIRAEQVSKTDSIVDLYHTYISSVIKSGLKYFRKCMICLKVILKKCTDLQQVLDGNFDRIMTSNIVDYIDFQTLLSSLRPLLNTSNKHAVLVTETMTWRRCCQEGELGQPCNEQKVIELKDVMAKDTDAPRLGENMNLIPLYDYFNDTEFLLRYLRCTLLATIHKSKMEEEFPELPNVFTTDIGGFQLRNFTKELNKVIPFRYRINPRICSTNSGDVRNLEWKLKQE